MSVPEQLVSLNVGGVRFCTSRATLLSRLGASPAQDSFFTALLSGRIASLKDESGAIFIDRDPELFRVILNYMRTRHLALKNVDVHELLHEAEFYGLSSLAKQLTLCVELDSSGCGDVLFTAYIAPPAIPEQESTSCAHKDGRSGNSGLSRTNSGGNRSGNNVSQNGNGNGGNEASNVSLSGSRRNGNAVHRGHSRNNSSELNRVCRTGARSRAPTHSRNSSADLAHHDPMGIVLGAMHQGDGWQAPLRVQRIEAHNNCLAVCYAHFVACYKQRDHHGFHLAFTTPYLNVLIERVAVNAKMALPASNDQTMLAVAYGKTVRLMGFGDDGNRSDVGAFNLNSKVDKLFFIGTQLVALSRHQLGVWNAMSQQWQCQDLSAIITAHDTAGSFLLLGSSSGTINYIDMQKFPLRMKDNDLLVTELYRDPAGDAITAISVYLTPKTSICGNWIEIAYGTSSGAVRVIVQHPETVGHGPQLFMTFNVHRSPVTRVSLSERYLISVCSEYNHVRTWSITRFRGMISTQPGSSSVASFKIVSLDEYEPATDSTDCGPFGEQDDEQVFVQKVVPETDCLFVRLASTGKRVCVIRSVDNSMLTSFCVHECDGSARIGARPRRFIFTGHVSGAVQMWDLSTALDFHAKGKAITLSDGGPTPEELVDLIGHCELSNSNASTPMCMSPSNAFFSVNSNNSANVKASNLAFLNNSTMDSSHHNS